MENKEVDLPYFRLRCFYLFIIIIFPSKQEYSIEMFKVELFPPIRICNMHKKGFYFLLNITNNPTYPVSILILVYLELL